ncbi:hypothetical protein MHY85_13720 [Cellulomonas sp. ACRRI]|uniref:hypothetical protein n=1 Tax=Cellulomonas sp. ACRRI TaxID=2918188 RepID=UPI001EF2F8E3|nr:hypothetical protein [Cellulomonas sp. ACRRI]MCG7287027.1 hypothetical protein [Cellulomonas sp. ACRRI]
MLHEPTRRRITALPTPVEDGGAGRPWHVRRAGLLDVNPLARMIAAHRPFVDLDGDGEPDPGPDPEQAGPATRLMLSLGAMEHGEVWLADAASAARRGAGDGDVAADAPADVAAVAVWLPPDADRLGTDLQRVVTRELGVRVDPHPEPARAPLRAIADATARTLALVRESGAERLLVLLADDGRAPAAQRAALLTDLLAPVAAEQGAAGRDVLAVTVDPAQVADLRALGFAEVARTPLGAASLWLGALRSGAAATGADAPARAQAATATA